VAAWLKRGRKSQGAASGLRGLPRPRIWKRDFTGAGGLFSVLFDARYTEEQTDRFVDALKLFKIGYSWGGANSLVMPYRIQGMRRQARDPGRRRQIRRLLRQQRGAEGAIRRQGRPRRHQRHGHLPQLHAGRALRVAAEDPADQFLRLRLPVLRQPPHLERAAGPLSVDEVVKLTQDFYLRNYIDGLFLSSGIIQSSDYTMEQLVEVARQLREVHKFRGYIHLKTIPDADPRLIAAGRQVRRPAVSVNIELPTQDSVSRLAPERTSTPSSWRWVRSAASSMKRTRTRRRRLSRRPGRAPR
jgi:hypothetical protein